MKLSKAKRTPFMLCISIIILAFAAVISYGVTGASQSDINISQDLEALSGLPNETILTLYSAVSDWEIIKENIFVYKRILNLVENSPDDYQKTFSLLDKYDPEDLLSIYELHSCP